MLAPTRSLLRIQLLGALQVTFERAETTRPLHFPSGPVAQLLGYLALYAPTPLPRTRLAGLLHPDLTEAQARRALTDALYRLRRALGDAADCLRADAETLHCDAASLWVDVHEFKRAAASAHAADWQSALDLYAGDLLQDHDAEWLLAPRAELRELQLATHERLCAALMQEQQWAEALGWAHRWTLADPLSEEAHRAAMLLYARVGRHAAALAQYDQLARLLADELAAAPLPETRALAAALRSEYDAAQEQSAARRRFVGRRRERARLLEQAEAAQAGQGRLALVEGEPGIGKTRLLEEFAESARWRGLSVVWGRAQQLAAPAPYTPLDQALAAALAGPRADQVRARLDPLVAQAVALLAPRLRVPPSTARQPPDLPPAIAQVLRELTTLAPHVLIFDDAHWADAGFWDVLHALAPALDAQALLIVLGCRSEELRNNAPAWASMRALDREYDLLKITLRGFELHECMELARASEHALTRAAALVLHQRTGGNPLFFAEALAQPQLTSESFRALLAARWAVLDPHARAALEAGAVLGREFTHGAWQAVTDTPLLDQIPLLNAARFIAETDRGYLFSHDLTREYVYRTIPPERLRVLHQRTGHALARARTSPEVVAWHFEQGGAWREAVRYYREAGERAARAYAHTTALAHYNHALDLANQLKDAESERTMLLHLKQRLSHKTVSEWIAAVDELEAHARAAADPLVLLEALEARISLHVLAGDWNAMQTTVEHAIALAQEQGDLAAEARVRTIFGWHLADTLGKPRDALAQLQSARALVEEIVDPVFSNELLGHLGFAYRLLGQTATAHELAQRVLTVADASAEFPSAKASALEIVGLVALDRAQWQAARTALRQATELAQAAGNQWKYLQTLLDQALLASWVGQPAEARDRIAELKTMLTRSAFGPQIEHWQWMEALYAEGLVLAGELELAEQVLQTLQPWIDSQTRGRPLLQALTAMGRLRLAQDRPTEASQVLAHAAAVWEQGGVTIEIAPLLLHALAAHRAGSRQAAHASLARAQAVLSGTEVTVHNVLLHFVRSELGDDRAALAAARAEIQRQASLMSDENLRAAFLDQVQLHREIAARWQAHPPIAAPRTVQLVRASVPLGKTLDDADYVRVQWTIDAGETDAAILKREGKAALRRHRLQRLLDQARAQGAAPTDDDLAHALGVDRRTILRDMAALTSQGEAVRTRRRKREE